MQGELGSVSVRYCAKRKGTRTAGGHLGSELISSMAEFGTLAASP